MKKKARWLFGEVWSGSEVWRWKFDGIWSCFGCCLAGVDVRGKWQKETGFWVAGTSPDFGLVVTGK